MIIHKVNIVQILCKMFQFFRARKEHYQIMAEAERFISIVIYIFYKNLFY